MLEMDHNTFFKFSLRSVNNLEDIRLNSLKDIMLVDDRSERNAAKALIV
jgi:hypothetical protein